MLFFLKSEVLNQGGEKCRLLVPGSPSPFGFLSRRQHEVREKKNLIFLWGRDVVQASENQGGAREPTASAFNAPSQGCRPAQAQGHAAQHLGSLSVGGGDCPPPICSEKTLLCGCPNTVPPSRGLHTRGSFSHDSGGWESRSKGEFLPRPLSLAWSWLLLAVSAHCVPYVCLSPDLLFL